LRENKMIATAGADRLQEGMRGAFGKAVSLAARVQRGQVLMEAYVKKDHLEAAKKALHGAAVKLPITPTIKVIKLKPASAQA
ncbi:MAG: 50S ribosomal protein L16, partial [Nitrosopumilaceae archaeon]